MDLTTKLRLLNHGLKRFQKEMLQSRELDVSKLNSLLSRRNEVIMRLPSTPSEYTDCVKLMPDEFKNKCEPLIAKTLIPAEFMAYHGGPKMQHSLYSSSATFRGESKLGEVYFSLNPRDIFRYLDLDNVKDNMTYVLDLKHVSESFIQKDYQSSVLWDDKINSLLALYNQNMGSAIVQVPKDKDSSSSKYISHFSGKKLSVLKDYIQSEMSGWKAKHTIPFNPVRLNRYKKSELDFILVGGPILVKYD